MQCFRVVIPQNTPQINCIFSVYTQDFREVCIYMYQGKNKWQAWYSIWMPWDNNNNFISVVNLLAEHIHSTTWVDYIILITIKSNQTLVFGEKENWSTWRKTSWSRVENQRTQPTYMYDVGSRNRTRDTLVEGERSHLCNHPCSPSEVKETLT